MSTRETRRTATLGTKDSSLQDTRETASEGPQDGRGGRSSGVWRPCWLDGAPGGDGWLGPRSPPHPPPLISPTEAQKPVCLSPEPT